MTAIPCKVWVVVFDDMTPRGSVPRIGLRAYSTPDAAKKDVKDNPQAGIIELVVSDSYTSLGV